MFIKYFIPEDGDDQQHPNVFQIQSSKPTLDQIKKSFPLPGLYHFRFLKVINGIKVWLDTVDGNINVPVHDGSITAKVSRLSLGDIETKTPTNISQSVKNASSSSNSKNNNNPMNSNPPATFISPSTSNINSKEGLINFDDNTSISPTNNTTSSSNNNSTSDLLGFDIGLTDEPISSSTNSNSGIDLFGGFDTPLQPSISLVPNNQFGNMHMSNMSLNNNRQQQQFSMGGGMNSMNSMNNGGNNNFDPFNSITNQNQNQRGNNQQSQRRQY